MSEFSKEQELERKKYVFDSMSPRNQKQIIKKGYEQWDPFQEPKDPIDMRKDKTKRTSKMLITEFLQSLSQDRYSNEFARGAFELCLGIINEDEKSQGMYAFSCWYRELLEKEGSGDLAKRLI